MATKKDLVEAYSFSRRRLVTAFVSGAPGGREVEPARPGRTLVGGLALSVLLVAGAAIAGIFTARADVDWTQPGLVVSKERGAMYVIVEESSDPELRPVINVTSAQLILGDDLEPEIVPQEDIEEQHVGDDIGILGAPADVPSAEQLIQSGWTACTAAGSGTAVDLSTDPSAALTPAAGYTVVVDGEVYVVAESRAAPGEPPRAHTFLVAAGQARDSLLSGLGLPNTESATEVSPQWLGLFPAGAPLSLDSFDLEGFGERPVGADYLSGLGGRVGDWFLAAEQTFVVTGRGPARLEPFEAAVYTAVAAQRGARLLEDIQEVPQVSQTTLDLDGTGWPAALPQAEDGELCALLAPEPGAPPSVVLASDPVGTASAVESTTEPGDLEVSVEDGRGAYVLSAGWEVADEGQPFLLTAKPARHELVGPQVAERLGYAGVDPPVVPDAWVELFERGVPLSVDAALCPPSADTPTGSSCS